MKAFAIIRMSGGQPEINPETHPYHGYVLADVIPGTNYGAYLVSGTPGQLQDINSLSHVLGICGVTEDGNIRWAELDGVCAAQTRDRINTWLENHNHPTIPDGWTYRRIIKEIYKRANEHFDLDRFDISDVN